MLISFIPVFALGGMEGRMFHPLAFTKSFAMIGVAILAITLVPALIPMFIRGRLRSEEESWMVRSVIEIYRPVLTLLARPSVADRAAHRHHFHLRRQSRSAFDAAVPGRARRSDWSPPSGPTTSTTRIASPHSACRSCSAAWLIVAYWPILT